VTYTLSDLDACFEGVIPSIIATSALDGTPNISYLSHVTRVDDQHVALSNQFFGKTARNVRDNAQAALLLVDPRDGTQYDLALRFVESQSQGTVFDRVNVQLRATSGQLGMAGVMRLRGVDVYQVLRIDKLPLADESPRPAAPERPLLAQSAELAADIAECGDVDDMVDVILKGLVERFGYERVLILHADPARGVLTTLGGHGYEQAVVGSEVPFGQGIIGMAAADRRLIKVSDMSRIQRFAAAVRSSNDEDRTREISLPVTLDAMSQVGVPMIANGNIRGVLFAESRQRFAFSPQDESALTLVSRQAAASMALAERLVEELQDGPVATPATSSSGATFRVTHHVFDDSVFIDDVYVIKGVPGRLLMYLLNTQQREGRMAFTNRELRLAGSLRLPDIKDNLETRLILLRRRLSEKRMPVQLQRTGRGQFCLQIAGNIQSIIVD
jgi:adenylate cyclase